MKNWFNKIIKWFKNLLMGIFIKISLSLSKTESVLLKNTDENDHTGDGNEIKNIQSDLLRSLYNGEYNKQYVLKFYQLLKKADNMIFSVDYSKIDNRKTDNGENYQLINIIKNIIEIKNSEEVILENKEAIKITKIKSRDIDRKYKIEEYTDYLHIKKYNENELLLEFYINENNNIDTIKDELKNIKNIYFTDKYGDQSEYNIIKYYKSSIYNFNYILKFIAKKI
jgi:hypothetical protein